MTTERMTDDEFKASLDSAANRGWDPHEKAARMFEVAEREAQRARRVEQEQAERIRALEAERVAWQDATGCASPKQTEEHVKALHSKADAANECARLANDKMAEQVRQARWEVADTALSTTASGMDRYQLLSSIRDANAPKD